MKVALILEDMPESQEMLREVAQSAFPGIRVRCESDVAGAMKIISQFRFDLALIDLSLPDGDGTRVIEALAERCPDIIIVVATIFDDDAHLFPALRAGAQGYLLKDQSVEHLINQLRRISEGQPPLSPSVARRLLDFFHVGSDQESGEATAEEGDLLLTPRESDVLMHLARGLNVVDIAQVMEISRHTVSGHVKNIYRKLKISSRAEAAVSARNLGLV